MPRTQNDLRDPRILLWNNEQIIKIPLNRLLRHRLFVVLHAPVRNIPFLTQRVRPTPLPPSPDGPAYQTRVLSVFQGVIENRLQSQ